MQSKKFIIPAFTHLILNTVWTGGVTPYLAQHLPTWWPAEALSQAIQEPEAREDSDAGGQGEDHVDAAHREQSDGEEPARTELVWEDAADELTDGIGQRLAAGDEACEMYRHNRWHHAF